MNTDISFSIAKLLEEKGYDEPCANLYYEPERCKKPTIADVVMWLYEKYEIWIVCTPFYIAEGRRFSADVFSADNKKTSIFHYKTPTEAYEAAIKYALKNSI